MSRWVYVAAASAVVMALPRAPVAAGIWWHIAEKEFVQQRIDAWPLARHLGSAGIARDVYARLEPRSRAHYYVLTASKGERIRVALISPIRGGIRVAPLRMALIGPGLPERSETPFWVEVPRGEGVVVSAPQCVDNPPGVLSLTEPAYALRQAIDVAAPARARYVLVVFRKHPGAAGDGAYRMVMAGASAWGLSTLILLPMQWFQAEYFVWPRRAITRLAAILAGAAAAAGLWGAARHHQIARQGGFIG